MDDKETNWPTKYWGDSLRNGGYPWEDVNPCLNDKLDSNLFKGHLSCHKCYLPSENLTWIQFCSPKSSWLKLMGCEGPLSICPDCNVQVEFICEVMN